MSSRRQIAWSAAMRDFRHQRAPRPALNPLLAHSIAVAKACDALRVIQAQPLTCEGRYIRSAIMTLALALARRERVKGSPASWKALMSSTLKFAWARAKLSRSASTH